MNKKVLIMCTGNSCRSIIGEALINASLDSVDAYSCGVSPSGKVNLNAKRVLEANGIWKDTYYSKHLDAVIDMDFDLVVTVCGHAQETCPIFPKPTPKVHIGFEDPDGKEYEAFELTYQEIKNVLVPKVEKLLNPPMKKSVFKTETGVKINFTGVIEKKQIQKMVENCSTNQCECMSDATKKKIQNMSVEGEDGAVELNLSGDVAKEEIEAALAISKVLKFAF